MPQPVDEPGLHRLALSLTEDIDFIVLDVTVLLLSVSVRLMAPQGSCVVMNAVASLVLSHCMVCLSYQSANLETACQTNSFVLGI